MSLLNSSAGCLVISYSKRITKSTPKKYTGSEKKDRGSSERYAPKILGFLWISPDSYASASRVHLLKSMGFLQPEQTCSRLNSSEKTSFSFPQFGHLQTKDFKFLRSCMPGQCMGVVMAFLLFYGLVSVRNFIFYLNNSFASRLFRIPPPFVPLPRAGGTGEGGWTLAELLSDLLAIVLGHLNPGSQ
jgi:hypothetical protein